MLKILKRASFVAQSDRARVMAVRVSMESHRMLEEALSLKSECAKSSWGRGILPSTGVRSASSADSNTTKAKRISPYELWAIDVVPTSLDIN